MKIREKSPYYLEKRRVEKGHERVTPLQILYPGRAHALKCTVGGLFPTELLENLQKTIRRSADSNFLGKMEQEFR